MGAEIGTFAHQTVTVRMPDITARTISENHFSSEINARLQALISEIHSGVIRLIDDPGAPDENDWNADIQPFLGFDWLHVPWFFAETYMYRRIIEATGYYQPGPSFHLDPFLSQKRMGLQSARAGIAALWSQLDEWVSDHQFLPDQLGSLLKADLWANQADLSIFPAGEGSGPADDTSNNTQDQLVVDDSNLVAEYLFSHHPAGCIDLVLDNAGFELACDLALSYFLLKASLSEHVRLHVKVHPTFVSDTIDEDIHTTLESLSRLPESLPVAKGLFRLLEQDRLQVTSHRFWTSPLPAWKMPEDLRQTLSRSDLVIFKGDANYRRLLGDLHWPFTTPFAEIVRYFPAPLIALRALKSEIVSGLSHGQSEQLYARDPKWLVNGKWGLLQYSVPSPR
jgi:uncharacterized protein with ATP-grasp and redox domains